MLSVSGAKRLLASASLIAMLAACAMTPEPFTPEQLAETAKSDRADMFKGGEPISGKLTVSDAIARALKYNLDRRAKIMEEGLALNQTKVDRWDLLPKLAANAGFTSRSEPNATVSRDLKNQTTGTSPTYSTDRDNYTADLGLSWNVLDFGLSYFTAKQNADKALIASERKRKTVHNLVQEVRFAFWRTAAHQFEQTDALWKVDKRLFELSDARSANDAQGMLERVAGRASSIASALRRFQTYAQVEQSYAKMQAAMGQDLMPDQVASHDLKDLSATIAQRLAEWNAFGATGQSAPAELALLPQTDDSLMGGLGRLFGTSNSDMDPVETEKALSQFRELTKE